METGIHQLDWAYDTLPFYGIVLFQTLMKSLLVSAREVLPFVVSDMLSSGQDGRGL